MTQLSVEKNYPVQKTFKLEPNFVGHRLIANRFRPNRGPCLLLFATGSSLLCQSNGNAAGRRRNGDRCKLAMTF